MVHNGAAAASTMTLAGVGTGTLPVITLSPPALSFSQTVGSTSADLRLLIGNGGTGMLRLGALTLTGAQAGEFALGDGDCAAGTTLSGGQSCALTLRFTPAASGLRQAELGIEHNALGGRSSVALAGWGNSSSQPGLLLDASRIDLGEQVVAVRSGERVLGVVNNGQAALNFSSISVTGTQAAEFALGGTCSVGTAVPAQGSCTIAIRVTPATLGARAATLQLAHNAPGGGASVSLAATGVPTAGASGHAVASGTRLRHGGPRRAARRRARWCWATAATPRWTSPAWPPAPPSSASRTTARQAWRPERAARSRWSTRRPAPTPRRC